MGKDKRVEPYEAVIEEDFTITDVVSDFVDREDGLVPRLTLDVKPENKIPVEKLVFLGYSPVVIGDYITAKVIRCYEKSLLNVPWSGKGYFERDFNKKESAIEITMWAEDGSVARADRSVDYRKFLSE